MTDFKDFPFDVPQLGSLDSAQLPDVGDRYAPRPAPARNEPRLLDQDEVLDAGVALDLLTQKAINKANQILDLDLDPENEQFTAILRAQTAQVQAIFTTQARVDEGRFKKKQADNMQKLLEILAGEEKKLLLADGQRLN